MGSSKSLLKDFCTTTYTEIPCKRIQWLLRAGQFFNGRIGQMIVGAIPCGCPAFAGDRANHKGLPLAFNFNAAKGKANRFAQVKLCTFLTLKKAGGLPARSCGQMAVPPSDAPRMRQFAIVIPCVSLDGNLKTPPPSRENEWCRIF